MAKKTEKKAEKKNETSLVEKFATNLKSIRAKLKLSQAELGEKLDYSTSMVSMLERGVRSPTLDALERICKALKLTPADLLG